MLYALLLVYNLANCCIHKANEWINFNIEYRLQHINMLANRWAICRIYGDELLLRGHPMWPWPCNLEQLHPAIKPELVVLQAYTSLEQPQLPYQGFSPGLESLGMPLDTSQMLQYLGQADLNNLNDILNSNPDYNASMSLPLLRSSYEVSAFELAYGWDTSFDSHLWNCVKW